MTLDSLDSLDHQRNSYMTLVKLHVSMRARPWSGILWSSSALMLPASLRRCVQDIDGLQPAIRPPTKSWPSWPWYSQPTIQGNSACTARPPNQTRRGLSICSEHYTSSSTWLEQHTHPLSLPHVWITGFVYKEQKTTETWCCLSRSQAKRINQKGHNLCKRGAIDKQAPQHSTPIHSMFRWCYFPRVLSYVQWISPMFSMVLVESHESSPTLATFMRCDRAGDHKIADPQLEICTGEGQKNGLISGWLLTYPSEKY